jgi:hypothetical protein
LKSSRHTFVADINVIYSLLPSPSTFSIIYVEGIIKSPDCPDCPDCLDCPDCPEQETFVKRFVLPGFSKYVSNIVKVSVVPLLYVIVILLDDVNVIFIVSLLYIHVEVPNINLLFDPSMKQEFASIPGLHVVGGGGGGGGGGATVVPGDPVGPDVTRVPGDPVGAGDPVGGGVSVPGDPVGGGVSVPGDPVGGVLGVVPDCLRAGHVLSSVIISRSVVLSSVVKQFACSWRLSIPKAALI